MTQKINFWLQNQKNVELVVDSNGDSNYILNTEVVTSPKKSKKKRKHEHTDC